MGVTDEQKQERSPQARRHEEGHTFDEGRAHRHRADGRIEWIGVFGHRHVHRGPWLRHRSHDHK